MDAEALNQEVGSNVHALMTKRGVKGVEIARLLELEPQTLSARLHGKTPFKAHELLVIARRLDVEPAAFFTEFALRGEFELIYGEGHWEEDPQLTIPFLTPVRDRATTLS